MKHVMIAFATAVALFSCQGNTGTETATAIENAKKATIDSMNTISVVKQKVIDSMNTVNAGRTKHAATATGNGPYENSTAATPAVASAPAKKKGWSHTAKGAVVGAGAGAVTGAIVNKDHLKGAAIGTLIGAGAGAATGAIVDHSKKKKSASQ